MSVSVACPSCRAVGLVPPEALGRTGQCTKCGTRIRMVTPVAEYVDPSVPVPTRAVAQPVLLPVPPPDAEEPRAEPSGTAAELTRRKPRPRSGERPARRVEAPRGGRARAALVAIAALGLVGGAVVGALAVRALTAPAEPQPELQTAAETPAPPPEPKPETEPQPETKPKPEVKPQPGPNRKTEPERKAEPKPLRRGQSTVTKDGLTFATPVASVTAGGGGRHLVFQLATSGDIVLYDAVLGRVTGTLQRDTPDALVTASRDKLFIARNKGGQVTRYDLRTGTAAATATLSHTAFDLLHLAVGSASDAPLLHVSREADGRVWVRLVDTDTFEELKAPIDGQDLLLDRAFPFTTAAPLLSAGVSADGRSMTLGSRWFTYSDQKYKVGALGAAGAHVPAPDGRSFVGADLLGPNGRKLSPDPLPHGMLRHYFPAPGGPFVLSVEYTQARPTVVKLFLHLGPDPQPFGELPGGDAIAAWAATDTDWVAKVARHVVFAPAPGALVFAPPGEARARVFPVDLPAMLARADRDVLFTSVPPAVPRPGRPFAYQPTAVSRNGPVTFRLEDHPSTMALAPNGFVNWTHPLDPQPFYDVKLAASDAAGHRDTQAFRLVFPKKDAVAVRPPRKGPSRVNPPVKDPPDSNPFGPKIDPPKIEFPPPIRPPGNAPPPVRPPENEPVKSDPSTGGKVVKLPAPFTTTAVGAGGRFVALHLPKLKQIAVFDVKEAKVVKYLPASDQPLLLAAGRDHLFVIDPGTAVLQRWSFATFEKEATVKLPDDGPFSAACTGAAATGPLLLFSKADRFGEAKALLINPITLRPVPVKDNGALPAGPPETMGASADGQTFAWLRGAHGGSVVVTVAEGKAEAKMHAIHGLAARPGPGGRYFYTGSSVLDAQMRRVYPSEAPAAPPTSLREFFPAVHGNLFFEVDAPFGPRYDGSGSGTLKVYVEGQFTPVATTQIEVPVTSSRDVYLVPRERAVVVPGKGRDELIVHPFDFDALLAKSAANYLLVTSEPPGEAAAGTKFEYAPVVKSKKGGVKFKLDAGPEGAKLVDGKLVWDVPAAMVKQEVSIILTVSDASGQELFHTFRVSVVAKPAGTAVVPDPPKPPAAPGPKEQPVAPAPGSRPLGAAGSTAFPITAPQFEAHLKTVKLPERFGAYCLAGAGRFVVFSLPAAKQMAIFDVSSARVVKYLPLAEADALIAGTARHVFVLNPTANVIQRWDLATFEKEATLANPVTGTAARLLAPNAANGPVFVLTKPDSAFGNKLTPLDPVKLLPLKDAEPARFDQPAGIRVSANGTAVAAFRKDTNAGSQAFSFDGKKFTGVPIWWGNVYGHVCPSPDGNTLYTSAGVAVGGKLTGSAYTIPAAEGNGFYLSVEVADAPHGSDTLPSKLKLHLVGDEKPLADLDRVDLPRGVNVWDRQAITPDERVLFIESARVVLVLPHGEREIEVYKLDPWAPLDKSGRDYLFVTSTPPALAVRGATFEYAPAVRAKRAGTKLKVDIGPDGMTAANGVVSWAVPKDFAGSSVTVALSATDDAQKTVFQTFELKVVAPADVPRPLPAAPAVPAAVEPAEPAPIVVPRPAGFRPTWEKDTAEIRLPVAATDLVYGGGGRFLLVTLEDGRGLAVVDLNTAKVVKTIPLPVGAHVTAGARVVVIYSPADKKIEVWGLEKLELLKRADAPADLTKFPLTSFVMGSGAEGPVFFHQRAPKRTAYIDLEALKIRDVPVRMFGWGPTTLEVSADGSLLVAAGGGWAGILVSQIRDGRALKTKEDANHDFWAITALGTPLPTADGRLLLSSGGVIDPDLSSKAGGAVPGYVVPTADAGFYLRIAPKGRVEPKGPNGPLAVPELTLYSAGHHKLFTLSGFKEFENTYTVPTSGATVMDDRVPSHLAVNRFLYHPRAGTLCTVAGDNRTVVLRKIDLATELKNAGREHLVVTSVPPTAVAGKRFTYTPTVLSSKGEPQVRLDAGPTGMRVEKGTVIWDVPASTEEAEVKLTITDASGLSLPHAFRVPAAGSK